MLPFTSPWNSDLQGVVRELPGRRVDDSLLHKWETSRAQYPIFNHVRLTESHRLILPGLCALIYHTFLPVVFISASVAGLLLDITHMKRLLVRSATGRQTTSYQGKNVICPRARLRSFCDAKLHVGMDMGCSKASLISTHITHVTCGKGSLSIQNVRRFDWKQQDPRRKADKKYVPKSMTMYQNNQRKFRSQTSDHMERWQAKKRRVEERKGKSLKSNYMCWKY